MRTIELSSLYKKDLRNPSRYLVHPLSFTTSISQLKSSKRVIFPQRGINPHLVARLTRGTTGEKEDSPRSGEKARAFDTLRDVRCANESRFRLLPCIKPECIRIHPPCGAR